MEHFCGSNPLPPLAEQLARFRPGAVPLGELLIAQGACSSDDVSFALEQQRTRSGRLGEILVEAGRCSAAAVAEALRAQAIAADPFWADLGRLAWEPGVRRGIVEQGYRAVGVPRIGRYVRLSEDELALAEALTMYPDYRAVLGEIWRARGLLALPEQLLDVGRRLRGAGILVVPGQPAALSARRREPGAWEIPLLDPSPGLVGLAALWRLTTRPGFVAMVWLPTLLAAAVLAALQAEAVGDELVRLAREGSLPGLYATLFGVLLVHEWGHAVVCHVRGAPVRRLGVMLYWGLPLGYCDVSGADLLGRRDRLAVALGGLYYQLGLASFCFVAWGVLGRHSSAARLALDVGLVAGGSLLFALNPLLRLDGYYLLADALGIPNLRSRALAFVAARLAGRRAETPTARERVWLWGYGLLAPGATVAMVAIALKAAWDLFLRLKTP